MSEVSHTTRCETNNDREKGVPQDLRGKWRGDERLVSLMVLPTAGETGHMHASSPAFFAVFSLGLNETQIWSPCPIQQGSCLTMAGEVRPMSFHDAQCRMEHKCIFPVYIWDRMPCLRACLSRLVPRTHSVFVWIEGFEWKGDVA